MSWSAMPTVLRSAHVSATCCCSLACDFAFTFACTFSVQGLNSGEMTAVVIASPRGHRAVGSEGIMLAALDRFPKNIERRERFSTKRKIMNVHAFLESSLAFIPSLCEVLTAQKHGSAISMQEMIFPLCSAFFCSTTMFFLEHKIQHTC